MQLICFLKFNELFNIALFKLTFKTSFNNKATMEGATNDQEIDTIEVVEVFASEGDLLDEKVTKAIKRKSLNKSCDDLMESRYLSQKLSIDENEDPTNVRTRTESSSSMPCPRPKTMGYLGKQKEHRKTNTLKRKMDKLRRKTTGLPKMLSFYNDKEKDETDRVSTPSTVRKATSVTNLTIMDPNKRKSSFKPDDRDSGYVEPNIATLIGNVARMSISIDRQMSIDASNEVQTKLKQAFAKVNEMIATEETYLDDLRTIVNGYWSYMKESKEKGNHNDNIIPMPEDLKDGKDKIAVSVPVIEQLFKFHERSILPWMSQICEKPKLLTHMFVCKEKDFKRFYGEFALNKTKSEAIIVQHNEYFNEIQRIRQLKGRINAQLMTPIQRIIRYPMLLKEICTNFEKAEQAANAANSSLSKAEIYKRNIFIEAYNSSQVLAEYTDQMLIASRITGYAGKISAHGILLCSAQVECQKKKTTIFKTKNEFKTCQIFIFERMILFACVDLKNTDAQAPLEYWTHFQIHQHLRTREVAVNGRYGLELDRNEDSQLKVPRKSSRSTSNALNAESYCEFIEQMVVVCKDEALRNQILQLINGRILSIKDYIKIMQNPNPRMKNYCDCFEQVVFDEDEKQEETNDNEVETEF